MFENYFRIAFRNLVRHKGYTFINIAGLAIGLTCCILIVTYIINELQFEKCHQRSDHVYRISSEMNFAGQTSYTAATTVPLGPAVMEEFPEVEYATRISPTDNVLISYEDIRFREDSFFFVDSTIFNIFTFPLLRGNPETALRDPFTMVISQEIAKKYFGDKDPIGQVLQYENQYDFIITGVLQDIQPSRARSAA